MRLKHSLTGLDLSAGLISWLGSRKSNLYETHIFYRRTSCLNDDAWGRRTITRCVPEEVAMVAFAGGAILYDTSNVLHHYPADRYVAAALELFASLR
jgi:hypothetical protein